MDDGGARFGMKTSSHRGNPGSSSAKNSSRNASLIYIYQEMEQRARERKKNSNSNSSNSNSSNSNSNSSSSNSNSKKKNDDQKVNGSNINQVETARKSHGNKNRRHHHHHHHKRRGHRDYHRGHNDKNRAVNFLTEMDGVRGIGVTNDDATPQELYAIGAVFDHIYRGGSPMNCVSVFRKEVNRRPPARMFGCGTALGCGLAGEDEKTRDVVDDDDDDDTLPTMDWTYIRSASMDDDVDTLLDLYSLDGDGTYDRSFRSRDSFSYSSLDADRAKALRYATERNGSPLAAIVDLPSDEENDEDTTGGRIGGGASSRSGKKGTGARSRSKRDRDKSGKSRGSRGGGGSEDETETDEDTMERLKTWSEVLVAAARDGACNGSSKRRHGSDARTDLTSLVHMLRNTVAENIPEDARAKLSRAFDTNLSSFLRSYDRRDAEDYYHHGADSIHGGGSDAGSEETTKRPLNSLARAMKNIATKEPTRTFAVSEQDQVVGQTLESKGGLKIKISPPVLVGDASTTVASSSVEVTIETASAATTPPRSAAPRTRNFGGGSSGSGNNSTTAANSIAPTTATKQRVLGGGGGRNNLGPAASSTASADGTETEEVGSHRGDASVTTPIRNTAATANVPASIRLPRSSSSSTASNESATKVTVLQEFFAGSSTDANATTPQRLSFFRRRDKSNSNSNNNENSTAASIVSAASPSRRHLPPVPPARSPTTPSSASGSAGRSPRSGDTIRTDPGFVVSAADGITTEGIENATVVTPPRSTTGISLKKRFSFRRKRTGTSSKDSEASNTGSPRSTMGVDTSAIFHATTDDRNTELFYDASVFSSNNAVVLATAAADGGRNGIDHRTTDGVFPQETDEELLGYEESSV